MSGTKAPVKKTSFNLKVNREEFIKVLEQVQPGLSPREIVQQSSCYVFKDGKIVTFNQEVACQAKSNMPKEFKGAVQAAPLLAILRQLPDDWINIEGRADKFVINGKNRQSGIVMEKEVLLPIDSIDTPKEWKALHEDFTDAIGIVQECASKDQSTFTFTCIHIHPKYMEACDNFQLTRYALNTGVESSFLVRRDSLKHVPAFDFTHISVTKTWVHFKTTDGVVMSCRRYLEKFEDLSHLLKDVGSPTVLPKALSEAAKRCQEFSSQNSDEDLVQIELKNSRLRIKGEGASGYHWELKRLKYDGPPMKFRIAPNLLVELLKRHTDCKISKKHRLIVNGGKFVYAVCLEKAK